MNRSLALAFDDAAGVNQPTGADVGKAGHGSTVLQIPELPGDSAPTPASMTNPGASVPLSPRRSLTGEELQAS